MTDPITNAEDLVNTRNVLDRIEELRSEREESPDDFAGNDELASLERLAEQLPHIDGYEHGITLIRDSYFQEYLEDDAEDVYGIKGRDWPFRHIDWEAAADEAKADYTAIEWDDVRYWGR